MTKFLTSQHHQSTLKEERETLKGLHIDHQPPFRSATKSLGPSWIIIIPTKFITKCLADSTFSLSPITWLQFEKMVSFFYFYKEYDIIP